LVPDIEVCWRVPLSKLIEDGIDDAWLEFYSGEMPKSPDDPVTTQKLLARLYIMPHTMRVEPDSAIASGDVGWVRIIGANVAPLPIPW
jgi:hypothetical protein